MHKGDKTMGENAYKSFQLGIPDYVTIQTEEQFYVSSGKKQTVQELSLIHISEPTRH